MEKKEGKRKPPPPCSPPSPKGGQTGTLNGECQGRYKTAPSPDGTVVFELLKVIVGTLRSQNRRMVLVCALMKRGMRSTQGPSS